MIAVWRNWLKTLLAIGLIVGCNSIAPGLAATTVQTTLAAHEDCHYPDQQDGGGGMTICKYSCLAVTPAVVEILAPTLLRMPSHAIQLHALTARLSPPDTPPPRT